jgi:hypothetical protein
MNWGNDIVILCAVDKAFLPGAYGLFNSLLLNGFTGNFRILKMGDFGNLQLPSHNQLAYDTVPAKKGHYIPNVLRYNYFSKLTNGKYLLFDGDIIVERPLGILMELLDMMLLISEEPESKYGNYDILYQRQLLKTGLYSQDVTSTTIPYANSGFMGFSLPIHQEFINNLVQLSFQLLEGITSYTENPDWFFIDQDMFNVVLRNANIPISVISPRLLEISNYPNKNFYNRPFPFQKQQHLHPKDQLKYMIHGAALRRPWKNIYAHNFIGKVKSFLYNKGFIGLKNKPTPYERAWAYYTCSDNLPIPISSWAKQHEFSAYKNILWRKVHGL